MTQKKPRSAVRARLNGYWRMEAANVVLVPGVAILLVHRAGGSVSAAVWVAAGACAALLVIGALYWRAALRQIEGAPGVLAYWIPRLAQAELPALALTGAAVALSAAELVHANGSWTPSAIGAVGLTVLAILEYINYYKIQLQHFDNWSDFRRLLSGKGLRTGWLRRESPG